MTFAGYYTDWNGGLGIITFGVAMLMVLVISYITSTREVTLLMLWHRLCGHVQKRSRVSVMMFDPSARGVLVRCSCGRTWAL